LCYLHAFVNTNTSRRSWSIFLHILKEFSENATKIIEGFYA